MFINEQAGVARFNGTQYSLSFEHQCEDVAGVCRGGILVRNKTPKQAFRVVFWKGLGSRWRSRFIL